MSDLRTQVDRVADRVTQRDDPFERLTQRRRRHHRNRRITAAVVALAVAAAGSAALYSAFNGTPRDRISEVMAHGVEDSHIRLSVTPGASIPSGTIVDARVNLPKTSVVSTGYAFKNLCPGLNLSGHLVPKHRLVQFPVFSSNAIGCSDGPPATAPYQGWVFAFAGGRRENFGEATLAALLEHLERIHIRNVTVVPVRFLLTTASKNTSPYPRGAFEACPPVKGTIETDGFGAGNIALRFSKLWARGEHKKARRYVDPSARKLENWAAAGRPNHFGVLRSRPARHDGMVRYGCGKRVAERSWEILVDDGTKSASLNFMIYLVRRSDGWKAWGSY